MDTHADASVYKPIYVLLFFDFCLELPLEANKYKRKADTGR